MVVFQKERGDEVVMGGHPLSPPGGPPFFVLRKIVTNPEAEVEETKGS